MKTTRINSNLTILEGAVKTGVLIAGSKAILFDCCDSVTFDRLADLGVEKVDMVLCTQHRRTNTAGAYGFVERGARLIVPAGERYLFDDPATYWNDPKNRWHIYHHQPGPQVPAVPLSVARAVQEGDVVEWEGFSIRVLDTPGATDWSVSYLVEVEGQKICFSGDAVYGPGQVWDFYSLQKGFDCISDYHGFLGNKFKLIPSLEKLGACGADVLVPSHGNLIRDPGVATGMVIERLDTIWRNYTAISCLNHYFPDLFKDVKDDPQRMKPVATHDAPDFVRRVPGPCFALISETGAALLMDCGNVSAVETIQQWMKQGVIKSVEGCWVTHYHDDHADALGRLHETIGCPIMTDEHMAEIIEHPLRFFLPCISPNGAPVARKTRGGESWQWHEFKLTAFHFPGQTYYHGGLLVEGRGKRIFFAGDSGSPTGIDDHCCPNRNFLGKGKGFRRCIAIWRKLRPDLIFNQHQERAFSFTDEELDYMDNMLAEREVLFSEMLPWSNPNFGTDENWVRTYPYEQETEPGCSVSIEVRFTNHGEQAGSAQVEPVLPEGWRLDKKRSVTRVDVPAQTDGCTGAWCANPDKSARVWIQIPGDAAPGRVVVPFRVTWQDKYLGQFRHAIVTVR